VTATLFNHEALSRLDDAIEANRAEAGSLVDAVLAGDPDACDRMTLLNTTWAELEQARYELTGIDPAPYTMRG
jgi:hypothetical protein